jgi:hypothetical protein
MSEPALAPSPLIPVPRASCGHVCRSRSAAHSFVFPKCLQRFMSTGDYGRQPTGGWKVRWRLAS